MLGCRGKDRWRTTKSDLPLRLSNGSLAFRMWQWHAERSGKVLPLNELHITQSCLPIVVMTVNAKMTAFPNVHPLSGSTRVESSDFVMAPENVAVNHKDAGQPCSAGVCPVPTIYGLYNIPAPSPARRSFPGPARFETNHFLQISAIICQNMPVFCSCPSNCRTLALFLYY